MLTVTPFQSSTKPPCSPPSVPMLAKYINRNTVRRVTSHGYCRGTPHLPASGPFSPSAFIPSHLDIGSMVIVRNGGNAPHGELFLELKFLACRRVWRLTSLEDALGVRRQSVCKRGRLKRRESALVQSSVTGCWANGRRRNWCRWKRRPYSMGGGRGCWEGKRKFRSGGTSKHTDGSMEIGFGLVENLEVRTAAR